MPARDARLQVRRLLGCARKVLLRPERSATLGHGELSYFRDIVPNSIVLVDDRDNPVTVLYNNPLLSTDEITDAVCTLLAAGDSEYVTRVIDNRTGQELLDEE